MLLLMDVHSLYCGGGGLRLMYKDCFESFVALLPERHGTRVSRAGIPETGIPGAEEAEPPSLRGLNL